MGGAMSFILILAFFMLVASLLALSFKLHFETAVAFVPLLLIAVGSIFSFFNALALIPYIIYVLLCILLFKAATVARHEKTNLHKYFTSSIVVFVAMGACLWWVTRGYSFAFWDDFTHWGYVAKMMCTKDQMYTVLAAPYAGYPPGASVLIYTTLKALHIPFREDLALFTQGLFTLSLIMPVARLFKPKNALLKLFCIFALFYIPAGINASFYQRLLVDGLLGVLLFYILFAICFENNGVKVAAATAGIYALALTKMSGTVLAFCASLFIFLYLYSEGGKRFKFEHCLPAAAATFATVSWALHSAVFRAGQQAANGSLGVFQGIKSVFSGAAPKHYIAVVQNFFKAYLFEGGHGINNAMPSVCWLAIFLIMALICIRLNPAKRLKKIIYAMFFFYFAFIISILCAFLFKFSAGEATMLASFHRYQGTIITAMALFFTAVVLVEISEKKTTIKMLSCAALAVAIVLCSNNTQQILNFTFNAADVTAQTQHDRYLSRQTAEKIAALGELNPRLYLISIRDDRNAIIKINLDLLPIMLSNPEQYTSIATSDYYDNPNTLIVTVDEWAEDLAKYYDYVYLYSIDEKFTAEYISLFEDETAVYNATMFRVNKTEDGITLVKVEM